MEPQAAYRFVALVIPCSPFQKLDVVLVHRAAGAQCLSSKALELALAKARQPELCRCEHKHDEIKSRDEWIAPSC